LDIIIYQKKKEKEKTTMVKGLVPRLIDRVLIGMLGACFELALLSCSRKVKRKEIST